jgi:putative transposase
MLGSSLFGAQLAAELGLPYAFASHFAPRALHDAIGIYRERFKPTGQLSEPYVIAGVGAIVAATAEDAAEQLEAARRLRARALFSRGGRKLNEEDIDAILSAPEGSAADEMLTYNAVGTPAEAGAYLQEFRDRTEADELIVVHQSNSVENRLRSVELLAEAVNPSGRSSPAE